MIAQYLIRHQQVIAAVADTLIPTIEIMAETLRKALTNGHKVLIMGNGGSAADAQHFSAELVGRFLRERSGLPAIALTTDTSILTAVGNDYGFDSIFSRQIEALAGPEDVVIGISTSGNSSNVLAGLRSAGERGCRTMALLGRDGGTIAGAVEIALIVPAWETPHIQEAHATVIHLLCALIDSTTEKSISA